MKSIINKIVNLITQVRMVKNSPDNENYPSAQVSYLKKATDVTRLNPYPIISNPPPKALGIKLNSQAQEQNRFAIFHDPTNRKRGLKPGEGGIENTLTGSYVLLVENGDVQVVSKNDLIEEITGNLLQEIKGSLLQEITGDLTSVVGGDINYTALGKISLNAPNIEINGVAVTIGTGALKDAARKGDTTGGGVITGGSGSVKIAD